jgi:hypothetical protein
MSLLQLPVITVSAPAALILATYGEKSLTFCSGCSSSPTILMSGRDSASILLAAAATALPNE